MRLAANKLRQECYFVCLEDMLLCQYASGRRRVSSNELLPVITGKRKKLLMNQEKLCMIPLVSKNKSEIKN